MIELFPHQQKALEEIRNGSILCGGVGSGKSLTALAYYYFKVCQGGFKINNKGDYEKMKNPLDLYIITTARKRDDLDWERESLHYMLSTHENIHGVKVVIDSWNNIKKYSQVKHAFFIFDEQRLVGSGVWVDAFLTIAKNNQWILLSATPGDIWIDYIPVFIANGFYRNRTEFIRNHVVYKFNSKFKQVDRYLEVGKLLRLRKDIMVPMEFERHTTQHHEDIIVHYDKGLFDIVLKQRWNIYEKKPVKNIAQLIYILRKIVNSDPERLIATYKLLDKHNKIIVFYNFDYELNILRTMSDNVTVAEWNGHKHEPIPNTTKWVYLVQYNAGAEGWNCIETNATVFYSLNYSHKILHQATGRIDRLNTKFNDLYYYHIYSKSKIDVSIKRALNEKRNFHESGFIKK